MSIVYVLKLSENKYYVGQTKDLEKRIELHKTGYGCDWTKKYEFVDLIESHHADSPFYEDMIVKTMMHYYGIENVRGGTYSQMRLLPNQYMQLRYEINRATEKCFKCCGKHFVKDCEIIDGTTDKCFKCNGGHYMQDCPNLDEIDIYVKETFDIGSRICVSGLRKAKRFINYFW